MALTPIEFHERADVLVKTVLSKVQSDSPLVLRYLIVGQIDDIQVERALAINAESLLRKGKAERIAAERERVADEVVALYAALHDDDDLLEADV